MTIYRTSKIFVDNQKRVLSAKPLADGEHVIAHAGLHVPLSVKGDEVTVYADLASGKRDCGYICGFPGYMNLRFDVFGKATGENRPVLLPTDGKMVVCIHGTNIDEASVYVERFDTPPVVYGERGR